MSFWRRLFRKGRSEAEEAEEQRETTPPPRELSPERIAEPATPDEGRDRERRRSDQLLRLRRVGRAGGYEVADAIAILRSHEGSPAQTEDLHALIEALNHPEVAGLALDRLRVACASLLEDRGRAREALALVRAGRSVPAMMMAAELHAARGELPKAVSMIERVLARAIDTPGARERHRRWSAQLGRRGKDEDTDAGSTVMAPSAAKSSFRLIREVARGGAGAVYEAEDEALGRRIAYKVYHRAEQDRAQIEREGRTAVRLAGPGILRVFDTDPQQGWLAMEWIGRGSLRDALKQGRFEDLFPLSTWLPALVAAVCRIHDEGLVHSDLKPANVLFRDAHDPVLSDFGACQPRGEPGIAGTPGYMSPERLDGGLVDPRDDVYAIGRIIEDVLGARDDASLADDKLVDGDDEARRWASVALACLAEAGARPADARAVLALAERGRPSHRPGK